MEVRLGVRPCLLQGEGEGLASFVLNKTVKSLCACETIEMNFTAVTSLSIVLRARLYTYGRAL